MSGRHAGVVAGRVPAAVPGARSWVAGVLGGWGLPETTVSDAVLMAGELLANAVRHGDGAAMALDVAWDGHRVRCAVAHEGEGMPRAQETEVWAESGRGLVLVEVLACAWGTEAVAGRQMVWFTIDAGDGA